VRSAIEQQLDAALKRHEPEKVFERPDVRRRIDEHPEADHLFVVLGTAVTEVGRDHSYRWAVAEPSSLRSLIQLLGRVRRHQPGPCGEPNVHVFSHNLRHFEQPGRAAYCRPGYERDDGEFHLETHDLRQLLDGLDVERLDARPRIVEAAPLQQQLRLADLEHARTAAAVLPCLAASTTPAPAGRRVRGSAQTPQRRLNAASWWSEPPQDALTTAFLPQQQRFRDDSAQPEVELRLMPDEEGERCVLVEMVDERKRHGRERPWLDVDEAHHKAVPEEAVQGSGIAPWGVTDYMEELQRLAQEKDMSLFDCALRYGAVTVPRNAQGWRFHPALGFAKAQV
jgi:CRISPR-associated endonuclease/helicase Cas3